MQIKKSKKLKLIFLFLNTILRRKAAPYFRTVLNCNLNEGIHVNFFA